MKLYILLSLFVIASCNADTTDCRWSHYGYYEEVVNDLINNQIKVELQGQYTYLHLSNLFLRAESYYPKIAKYFRAKSDEEMSHAEQFMDYQNRRGGEVSLTMVKKKVDGKCTNVETPLRAFECAKELENDVTSALTDLLADVSDVKVNKATSSFNATTPNLNKDLLLGQSVLVTVGERTKSLQSFPCGEQTSITKVEFVELAEMIAHDFLGHQVIDTKELANLVSTLTRFGDNQAEIGAFLTDKHLDL